MSSTPPPHVPIAESNDSPSFDREMSVVDASGGHHSATGEGGGAPFANPGSRNNSSGVVAEQREEVEGNEYALTAPQDSYWHDEDDDDEEYNPFESNKRDISDIRVAWRRDESTFSFACGPPQTFTGVDELVHHIASFTDTETALSMASVNQKWRNAIMWEGYRKDLEELRDYGGVGEDLRRTDATPIEKDCPKMDALFILFFLVGSIIFSATSLTGGSAHFSGFLVMLIPCIILTSLHFLCSISFAREAAQKHSKAPCWFWSHFALYVIVLCLIPAYCWNLETYKILKLETSTEQRFPVWKMPTNNSSITTTRATRGQGAIVSYNAVLTEEGGCWSTETLPTGLKEGYSETNLLGVRDPSSWVHMTGSPWKVKNRVFDGATWAYLDSAAVPEHNYGAFFDITTNFNQASQVNYFAKSLSIDFRISNLTIVVFRNQTTESARNISISLYLEGSKVHFDSQALTSVKYLPPFINFILVGENITVEGIDQWNSSWYSGSVSYRTVPFTAGGISSAKSHDELAVALNELGVIPSSSTLPAYFSRDLGDVFDNRLNSTKGSANTNDRDPSYAVVTDNWNFIMPLHHVECSYPVINAHWDINTRERWTEKWQYSSSASSAAVKYYYTGRAAEESEASVFFDNRMFRIWQQTKSSVWLAEQYPFRPALGPSVPVRTPEWAGDSPGKALGVALFIYILQLIAILCIPGSYIALKKYTERLQRLGVLAKAMEKKRDQWALQHLPQPEAGWHLVNKAVYTLEPKHALGTMVVDVKGANTTNGTDVILFDSQNTNAQKFRVHYCTNGYYMFTPLCAPGSALDYNGSGNKQCRIWQQTSTPMGNPNDNQLWTIIPEGEADEGYDNADEEKQGYFRLEPKTLGGECLDTKVPNEKISGSTRLIVTPVADPSRDSQLFYFKLLKGMTAPANATLLDKEVYRIEPRHAPGMRVEVIGQPTATANGTKLGLNKPNGGQHSQRFMVYHCPGGMFMFAPMAGSTTCAIDMTGHGNKDCRLWNQTGKPMETPNANQLFSVAPVNDGGKGSYYTVTPMHFEDQAWDISGAQKTAGAKLLVWKKHGGHNQQFRFIRELTQEEQNKKKKKNSEK